jgi:glutaredoxin
MVEELISSKLNHGQVVMWTLGDKCVQTGKQARKAKKLLRSHGIEFQEVDVSKLSPEKQNLTKLALQLETGYTQLPNIYFGTEHLGGFDDLVGHLQSQNIFQELLYKNGIQTSDVSEPEVQGELGIEEFINRSVSDHLEQLQQEEEARPSLRMEMI